MSDSMLHPHNALIYVMVIVSAADRNMSTRELRKIGDMARGLPVFEGFDEEQLVPIAEECAKLLGEENGLERVMNIVVASLPAKLAGTAYAIACEVAAADQSIEHEEFVLLQMIRKALALDPLTSAAIERGIMARNMKL